MATGIQWTDETWNPVTGCSKVSPGCAHCYAEVVAGRFWPKQYPAIPIERAPGDWRDGEPASRPRAFTDVQCHDDRLDQPLRWKRPRRVFVNSMSDLFHEDVPDAFIDRVFAVMALARQHTFQVLTKRAERMRTYFSDLSLRNELTGIEGERISGFDRYGSDGLAPGSRWPLPLKNVWLGVSVENQRFADERLPLLLETPAAVRFVSLEPLLADVGDLSRWLTCDACGHSWRWHTSGGMCQGTAAGIECYCVMPREPSLDWVIVGGESGTDARPFDIAWARSIVAQGKAAGVPVFVKQLGANPHARVSPDIAASEPLIPYVRLRNKKGGDPSEWPEDLRVREFPA